MSKFVLFLLILATLHSFAQPVILNSDSPENRGKIQLLDEKYAGRKDELIETPFSVRAAFDAYYQQIFPAEKYTGLVIVTSLFTNAEGKIDYLTFHLSEQVFLRQEQKKEGKPGLNIDSLAKAFPEQISPFLKDFVSRRTKGRKSVLSVRTMLMPQMTKRRSEKDSVISSMERALATKDTLRIKVLALGQMALSELPAVIYRFPNLEELLLQDNDLETFTLDMSRLPKLRQVDLSGNFLSAKKISISKNQSLKLLNLLKNDLHDIPATVKNCHGLETLWVGSNKMDRLSNGSFRRAKRIKDLNFYKADIARLPNGIKKMKDLEVLDLYYNNLKELPKSITKLKKLTHLAISHNQIGALPERIDKLENIHTLYTHHNHLSKLPASITKMKNLKILDLGYNWFTQFPNELTAFVKLQELDLSSNNFPEFPEQLLKIEKLDKLYLRGNPFLKDDVEKKYGTQLSQLKNKNIEVYY